MDTLYLCLYIVSAVCFAIAFVITASPRVAAKAPVNLVALGLLSWVLVPLIFQARHMD